jgi:uncharacterized protein
MKFEVYQDKRGEWRWRLRVRNGKVIADSGEGYKRRASCLRGIKRVTTVDAATKVVVIP